MAWHEDLLQYGIGKPETEKMTLEELWVSARNINAAGLAEELLGPSDENLVETSTMLLTMSRALGSRGEQNLAINLPELAKALGVNEDDPAPAGIAMLISGMIKDPFDDKLGRLAKRLIAELPDGIGEVYLMDPAVPLQESERLDLKTALKLAINPCRIDR
ncbi:MAG: hypothetical protein HY666_03125 [Chloroflexi bacterium]|nr:hypothetical protein [Chloroflexota bacterium]